MRKRSISEDAIRNYEAFITRCNLKSQLPFSWAFLESDIVELKINKAVCKIVRNLGWTKVSELGEHFFIERNPAESAIELKRAVNNYMNRRYKSERKIAGKMLVAKPQVSDSQIGEIHSMLTRIIEKLHI